MLVGATFVSAARSASADAVRGEGLRPAWGGLQAGCVVRSCRRGVRRPAVQPAPLLHELPDVVRNPGRLRRPGALRNGMQADRLSGSGDQERVRHQAGSASGAALGGARAAMPPTGGVRQRRRLSKRGGAGRHVRPPPRGGAHLRVRLSAPRRRSGRDPRRCRLSRIGPEGANARTKEQEAVRSNRMSRQRGCRRKGRHRAAPAEHRVPGGRRQPGLWCPGAAGRVMRCSGGNLHTDREGDS